MSYFGLLNYLSTCTFWWFEKLLRFQQVWRGEGLEGWLMPESVSQMWGFQLALPGMPCSSAGLSLPASHSVCSALLCYLRTAPAPAVAWLQSCPLHDSAPLSTSASFTLSLPTVRLFPTVGSQFNLSHLPAVATVSSLLLLVPSAQTCFSLIPLGTCA